MDIKLPEISDNSEKTVVTLWHVKEGDRVEKEQDIAEVVTDKATFDLPAPCSGILIKINKAEGEKVVPGDILAQIEAQD